jgi:hypothetical protein
MDKQQTYVEGQPFYYQIGEVSTITPWWRPNYDRIHKFLTQEEVMLILNKYEDVEIIGGCLCDMDSTWDLDLRLIPHFTNANQIFDWDEIENDINKLNYLALNEWRLLLDVGFTSFKHTLPRKSDVIESLNSGNNFIGVYEPWIAKIAYIRKVIGNESHDYDIRKNERFVCEQLTNRYLVRYYTNHHDKKIVDKILSSDKNYVVNSISLSKFLEMSEEEFIKFQKHKYDITE